MQENGATPDGGHVSTVEVEVQTPQGKQERIVVYLYPLGDTKPAVRTEKAKDEIRCT